MTEFSNCVLIDVDGFPPGLATFLVFIAPKGLIVSVPVYDTAEPEKPLGDGNDTSTSWVPLGGFTRYQVLISVEVASVRGIPLYVIDVGVRELVCTIRSVDVELTDFDHETELAETHV